MYLGDFHIHSSFSDGVLTIPQIVDLYGQHGFGAIAITDHFCEEQSFLGKAAHWLNRSLNNSNFAEYLEQIRQESERAWDQYRMVVLSGVEITKNSLANHKSAHILGLNVQSAVSADLDALEIAKKLRSQGALTIAAHPVPLSTNFEIQTCHLWNRQQELAPYFDAWEVGCGQQYLSLVAKSALPKIASSDLHLPKHISSWKTLLDCERHPEAILAAIQKQEIRFTYFEAPEATASNLLRTLTRLPTPA